MRDSTQALCLQASFSSENYSWFFIHSLEIYIMQYGSSLAWYGQSKRQIHFYNNELSEFNLKIELKDGFYEFVSSSFLGGVSEISHNYIVF